MGEKGNMYREMVERPKERRPFGRARRIEFKQI